MCRPSVRVRHHIHLRRTPSALGGIRQGGQFVGSQQSGCSCQAGTSHIEQLELPPLSVFLEAVSENATVKRARSQVEQIKNEYKLQKRDWLNYFRVYGNYSYGRYNILGTQSDEYTPMFQTSSTQNQHFFNVGASVGFSLGDLINRPLKLKNYRHQIKQLEYTQEDVMEERRLRVLDAYNEVTEQLATINAKAETAALYNAQMKIIENDFIQGKMDITGLSLERARRTGAFFGKGSSYGSRCDLRRSPCTTPQCHYFVGNAHKR